MNKGLIMVFTGNGKGKTTAALGQAMRAVGQGFRVCFIQFIKGSWKTGEQIATPFFNGQLEFHVFGRGFLWDSDDIGKDEEVGRDGWAFASEQIKSGKFDLIVLDELTYVMNYMALKERDVIACLKTRPDQLHVVITGSDAPRSLLREADLVTVMKEEKHPYYEGIPAQRGIEF